jgi:hypothetical protein
MKKQFLTSTLLFAVLFAAAQVEVTSYRGAFAPAPTRMWTESWTNWDPQNTSYPATTVNVAAGYIRSNTTWTSNNVYLLQGVVYVDSLVTLTIEPGTIIRGDANTANSSLIVTRGGRINAEGTVCNPIVFTSSKAIGARAPGDWGGIVLLGQARNNQGTNILIEGFAANNIEAYYGGNNDNDNSGTLKYVRIEYGGYVFSTNNEINGLTMGSVGRGTTIDYVQTSFTNDDSFEWFGGTVNCKHLVAYRGLDDEFDADFGWSGTVQFALGVKDPAISDNPTISTSEGFEVDNDAAGTNQGIVPKTSGSFYNVTQIGAFRCASNTAGSGVTPTATGFRRGARLRRNCDIKIFNSILMNNQVGLHVDGSLALANMDQDSLLYRNCIIAGDFSTSFSAPYAGLARAYQDAGTRSRATNALYSNDSVNTCSLLTNAWNFTNPDYRPNTSGDGATVVTNLQTGADLTPGLDIDNTLFTPSQGLDFVVNIFESGSGSTNGIITITIPKISGWNITVPGLTLSSTNQLGTNGTSDVFGGTTNNNGDWNFREDANNVFATSKAGVVIGKSGAAAVGFRATRKASTSTGTNQNLGVNLSGGGDTTPGNNSTVSGFSTSN